MMREYFIDGDAVMVSPNWSIADKINARSTLRVTVISKQSATIAEGVEFQMFNDSVKIFEGIILRVKRYEDSPNYLYYDLDIVDNSALADRRVIAKSYVNQTAGYIANDIISEVLGEEGVTAGIIATGPLISKAVFNYIKCSAALDYIKKVTGYNWNIDKDKKLQFFDRSTNTAPVVLTDSTQHRNFQQESNMDSYRNVQYVRGGRGKTAAQTNEVPSPAPDGKSRTFVLRFPVAEQPEIQVNLTGAGWTTIPVGDIGVNGIDKNKKWYWTYNSQILTQDTTQTVLVSVDAIRINYVGLRNLFIKIENPAEIATNGRFEVLNTEKSINTSEQGIEFGNGLIKTYGEIKDNVSFSTEIDGLQAGQLLKIEKTLYGINDSFLIESIGIKPSGAGSIEYTVKALDGASVGGWEEFFKELLQGNRDYAINENEVLILLNLQSESVGYSGSMNIKVFECLYPSETLYPSEALYPGTKTLEVDLVE